MRATPRSWRPLLVVLCALCLLAACTSEAPPEQPQPPAPEPEPPASSPLGASVAVVLPSDEEVDTTVQEELELDVSELAQSADDGIREVRALIADGPAFVGDLTELLAERDTDLVCVLGSQGATVTEPLAERYGDVRFCSIEWTLPPKELDEEGGEEGGESVIPLDEPTTRLVVRAEELGHAVGVAAAIAAGGDPVGLVLAGDELPDSRFRAGLLAALAGVEVVEPETDREASLEDQAVEVLEAGAEVVVVDGGPGAGAAVEAVAADATVLGPQAVTDRSDVGNGLLLAWNVRWDVVLRGPLGSLLGEVTEGAPLGFADDVFELEFAAADQQLVDAVMFTVEQIAAGDRDPLWTAAAEGQIGPVSPDPDVDGPDPGTDGPADGEADEEVGDDADAADEDADGDG